LVFGALRVLGVLRVFGVLRVLGQIPAPLPSPDWVPTPFALRILRREWGHHHHPAESEWWDYSNPVAEYWAIDDLPLDHFVLARLTEGLPPDRFSLGHLAEVLSMTFGQQREYRRCESFYPEAVTTEMHGVLKTPNSTMRFWNCRTPWQRPTQWPHRAIL
jgi:hypothetical protein